MKIAIVIAPTDFKDESLSKAELLLDKKGIGYDIASTSKGVCKGYHGAEVKQSVSAENFEPVDYDAIFIIDGPGVDSNRLFENRQLLDRIRYAHENKKPVVAIGNAIKVVAKANAVKDTRIANVEDEEAKRLVGLYRGNITEEPVEMHNGILTVSDYSYIDKAVDLLAEALGVK